jgi:acyl phosphate:glycerol-3-phosphate acyltransferase
MQIFSPVHVVILFLAYLLGSLPFGVIFSKLFGLADPRSYGSKNIGATNVLRSGHKIAAFLTLLGDLTKGFLAIKIAEAAIILGFQPRYIFAVAITVFVGHIYSIFLKFKGGKGVAVAAGVLLSLNPLFGFMAILTWLIVFVITKVSALSALSAASLVLSYGLLFEPMPNAIALIIIACILIYRHRENIERILSEAELKF